jgi:hypothetical protein
VLAKTKGKRALAGWPVGRWWLAEAVQDPVGRSRLPKSKIQKLVGLPSLTFPTSLIEKKLDDFFSHETFAERRSGSLFGKIDFGGLPFSNQESVDTQSWNSS